MVLLALAACTPDDRLLVRAGPGLTEALGDFVGFLDDPRVSLAAPDDPPHGALVIDVDTDDGCLGCYTLASTDAGVEVTGGDVTGAQYGLADVLERMGFGFYHPYDTQRPAALALPDTLPAGETVPALARRGLQLHTLHPIEALAACYIPNDTDECRRILDWLAKNRGNYVQWPLLDDLLDGHTDPAAWAAFTGSIVDYAHSRGIEAGVGIQLFGASNLQSAFDLVDDTSSTDAMTAAMDARLAVIAPVPWDMVSISFGEFSGEDPDTFIAANNLAYDRIQAAMPGVDVNAVIHVGNSDDLRVTYDGQEMLYYFLVQYANPAIQPWVHTVMYYDLEEDAGGAYGHDRFDEHAAFLADRLAAGQPVAYFPESAYWVAFDDPVPLYLPLYMRSRGVDLAAYPTLDEHVSFSSGWEWGYWQNDVAALRMAYTRASWQDTVAAMFPAATASTVVALADLQDDALITQRLAPYLAGRDAIMDAGFAAGIVAQPDRVGFDTLLAADAATQADFQVTVLTPLTTFADAMDALPRPSGDRWSDEVADGVEIDVLRAAYVRDLYAAVLAHADATVVQADLSAADDALDAARAVVARRQAAFHDPDGARWAATNWTNPTIYDYGYLAEAQSLCFWERERAQVRDLLLGETEPVSACVL